MVNHRGGDLLDINTIVVLVSMSMLLLISWIWNALTARHFMQVIFYYRIELEYFKQLIVKDWQRMRDEIHISNFADTLVNPSLQIEDD